MKKITNFFIVFVLALVVLNTQRLLSQTILDEDFTSGSNGIWEPQQSATYVVENGLLKVTFSQAAPKYRADLKAVSASGVTVNALAKPYLAIKFTKPSTGNVILDCPLGAYGNGSNKYSTELAAYDVYYYDLANGTFGASAKSLPLGDTTLSMIQFKVADITSSEGGYDVDWVKTFSTYTELEQAALADVVANADSLTEEFNAASNGIWFPQQSATYTVENGSLNVTFSQAAPNYRADLKAVPTSNVLISVPTEPYLAIKFTRPSTGNVILDSPFGSYGNGSNNYETDFADQDIYFYNLQTGTFGPTAKSLPSDKDTVLSFIQFKIADISSSEGGYQVDWIRTYATYEEVAAAAYEVKLANAASLSEEFNADTCGIWIAQQSATYSVDTGYLSVTFPQASANYRADLKASPAEGVFVSASSKPILAVKFTRPSTGNITLDCPLGAYGNGANNYEAGLAYKDVYYYNLQTGTFGSSAKSLPIAYDTILSFMQFKIADISSDEGGYQVDWIREYDSYESLASDVLSADASLSDLTPSTGTLTPSFETNTTSYNLTVEPNTSSVNLSVTTTDAYASYTGGGTIDLTGGTPVVENIEVTAENGIDTRTYSITIADRILSNDSTLSEITISAGSLTPAFSSDITSYSVVVPKGTKSVKTSAVSTDPNASVSDTGTVDLSSGSATTTIVCAAENGISIKEYVLDITVDGSAEASLDTIITDLGELSPNFSSEVMNYALSVPAGTDSVNISATAVDPNATITGDGKVDVTSGSANITIMVTAENEVNTKEYMISITVEPSTDATLSSITLSVGELSPAFSNDVTAYTILLPVGTTSVDIDAEPTDTNSTVQGTGTLDVSSGSANTTITVTAEDGTTVKEYTLSFTVDQLSNDADLSSLTVSQGSLSPAFSSNVISYTLDLPYGTTEVTVTGSANDINASVAGDGLIDVSSGSATVVVEVTAEDGTTTKSYTIEVSVAQETSIGSVTATNLLAYYSNGQLVVSNINTNTELSVFDIMGKKIYSGKVQSDRLNLTVKPGIYLIIEETNNILFTHKIVCK